MERLLKFGTSTVPPFLTPVDLRDQCHPCPAAKHKRKNTLADTPWFPASPSRSGASWSHTKTRAVGEHKYTPPTDLWVPEACWVQRKPMGTPGPGWALAQCWVQQQARSWESNADLKEQGWSLQRTLPTTCFFLWRLSLCSFLLYPSLSTFWLLGESAALNAAPGHMLGFAFALCCAMLEAKLSSKAPGIAQECIAVALCKADEDKTCR